MVNRFDVFLVSLDPTIGAEIQKTRPCVVISPDQMNRNMRTVLIAPMTSKGRDYPMRVACQFENKPGEVILDQIRGVDKRRLIKRLGRVSDSEGQLILKVLMEMFAE
jgi:mRNA interferase MazF